LKYYKSKLTISLAVLPILLHDGLTSIKTGMCPNLFEYVYGEQAESAEEVYLTFNFADCHTDCDQPDAIRSVYLIDGDIDDNMILEGSIDDRLHLNHLTQTHQFIVPNGVTGSNTFNKLVIETQQADDNSAFYIQKGVEVS
jgi:hypothetical protein